MLTADTPHHTKYRKIVSRASRLGAPLISKTKYARSLWNLSECSLRKEAPIVTLALQRRSQ